MIGSRTNRYCSHQDLGESVRYPEQVPHGSSNPGLEMYGRIAHDKALTKAGFRLVHLLF